MIRVILIDDEPLSRDILKAYLRNYPGFTVVAECGDGFEGLKAISMHTPDLIFLDIQMPRINGLEMLELVEHPPAVVFTTAFDQYALQAFEASALDYLLKPFSEERFKKAIDKFQHQNRSGGSDDRERYQQAADRLPSSRERVVVRTGNRVKILPVEDIHYLQADDDYVKIVTREGHFLKNKTLQHFEESLDAKMFVRVHRSFLLNVSQLTRIDPYLKESYLALLRSGAKVPVSKTGYARLKEQLGI